MAKQQAIKTGALTPEEKENICAEILGIHPKYLQAHGITLKVDVWQFEHDTGKKFKGFPGKLPAETS